MSGRWMTAGDRYAGYRSDVPGVIGDGFVSNFITRAVLRELCRIAHDAGIAQVAVPTLADRIGVGQRITRRALARLQSDEVITRAIRGTGNRHGTQPRASVWVLHQLADANGDLWPHEDWLSEQWSGYLMTKRYYGLDLHNRRRVAEAWTGEPREPVDNSPRLSLLAAREGSTSGTPVPHSSQGRSQKEGPDLPSPSTTPARIHPQRARRQRRRLSVITAGSSGLDLDPQMGDEPA